MTRKPGITACYYCTKDVPVRRFMDYDGPHWICADCLHAWAATDTEDQWRREREDHYSRVGRAIDRMVARSHIDD